MVGAHEQKSRQRPASQNEREARILQYQILADAVSKTLQSLFKWDSLFGCVYYTMDMLKAYAGKTTWADVNFAAAVNDHLASVLGMVFGISGVWYGHRERKLRKDTMERLHRYQRRYEESRDPGRTSSRLTRRGDTRQEDE